MPNAKFWILFGLWVFSLFMLSEELSPLSGRLYWPCFAFFFLTTGYLIYQVWLVNRRQKTVLHRESDNDLEKG
jgi:hypothetical protein